MGGQIQGLRALGEREAVADQPFQIDHTVHDKTDRLILQVDRCTIGPHQGFLVDTDGRRIDQRLSVLRLRKQQYPATGTGRIHRGANQGVSADSENDRVGATPFRQFADALDYAAEWKPAVILDYATLTGAALVALGLEAAIVFTDDDALAKELVKAGERTDERLWRLPMWEEYRENIRSDWADMKNTGGRWGGSINGAMFLKEFVDPKTPWAHLDIAGTAYYDRDHAGYPVGATSFGLGLTLRWLRDRLGPKKKGTRGD